ncbi:MAG: PSD1 and planctomycete cytochrome C domain-containing protein [Pirellulaceae bacterium]
MALGPREATATPWTGLATWVLTLALLLSPASHVRGDDSTGDGSTKTQEEFFEKHVRPVLVERCSGCHGAKKQEAGLRVDSRQGLLTGGDTGAAIIPGDVGRSLMLQAVRREGGLEMPPDRKLPDSEIRVLEQWVRSGAVWPGRVAAPSPATAITGKGHWAFQPVTAPNVPRPPNPDWVRTPVDAFIAAKLSEAGLSPSPPADRRTWLRRVTYSLTGLPPTADEVERFVSDGAPDAHEKVVERLLASPHYGEHWARHWLDVARYSDTKGYVYAREERFWTHAWAYRDWVAAALNDDLPYDRFLLLQLAADQVEDRRGEDLAAMGFLTLGRRFLGVRRDVIDDRIDVVCRGTMALTVGCARCHDHKYDPIPTADYYSLYGVFDSCLERQQVLTEHPGDEAFQQELEKRQAALQGKLTEYRQATSARARQRAADYLFAQSELQKYPADGFDQIFQKSDLLPAFVRKWERYLRTAKLRRDPIFTLWHAYAELDSATFAQQAQVVARRLHESSERVPPRLAAAFAAPPHSFREVCDRYGQVLADVDAQWREALAAAEKNKRPPPAGLDDPDDEALRQVLYGEGAPCQAPGGPISHCETYFDSGSVTELWKLQGEVDRWLIKSPTAVPVALTLVDQATPVEPRIFRRGNPLNLGDDVPRRFLSVLGGKESGPFRVGSGRRELAEAIIDPANPLTARVLVNRVWMHHFGAGLVTTPSDFGLRSDPPSHPQLLDWLAVQFVREGWSLKQLHRWIVLSATYRQASASADDAPPRRRSVQIDPDNRLLWRMIPRRLTFEEARDSLLQATGELDRTVGGKPMKLFDQPFPTRRTLYGLVDRQYFPGALRMFDFANPDLHVPQRSETTVPQQALFFMNHPLVLQRARALAQLVRGRDDARDAVGELFQRAYQRRPTDAEVGEALELLRAVGDKSNEQSPLTANDWQYGYGAFDQSKQQVTGFTRLPHFTGQAWQGGPAWPDAKLGWVQLTAEGGHPGNDRQHAAVRRWTAPRDTTVAIRSHLVHEPEPGDGIRAFLVSSRRGLLASAVIHKKTVELNVDAFEVEQGETIDFVVDIGDVLNSDQYLWKAIVEERSEATPTAWSSTTDFPNDRVDAFDGWEMLAQVVLCSNEFLFVD